MKYNRKIYFFLLSILIITAIISLIPIFNLSLYDCATGDDFGYGRFTHNAWISTGSVWQVIKAACYTVADYYKYWQGTWFTIFVMTLQPEVFSPYAYWIVPWLMIGIEIAATTYLCSYYCGKILGMPIPIWGCIDILILFATIQYFPSTASSIFWFNGCAHYIIPYGCAAVAIISATEYYRSNRFRYLVTSSIFMSLLGGSSYLMPLVAFIITITLLFISIIKRHPQWLLIIPIILELLGLIISFCSPGNTARGGEDFGFSIQFVIYTICESILLAAKYIFMYLNIPFVLICVTMVAIISISFWMNNTNQVDFFRLPGLFILLMCAIYASTIMPGVYAGVEVSGGVPNTIFQTFILTMCASEIYITGWIVRKSRNSLSKSAMLVLYLIFVIGGVMLVINKGTIKSSTTYKCYNYYISGRANDYKSQIAYNKSLLLNNNVKDCHLCPVNSDQGPLMHMPAIEDENAFTNTVMKAFYNKDHVITDWSVVIPDK